MSKTKIRKSKCKSVLLILCTSLFLQSNLIAQSSNENYTVDIGVKIDDAIIQGTLALPVEDGKYPVMIIVPGSGRITRQDLGMVAAIFGGLNIATFIYDKRGVGQSTGEYTDIGASNSIEGFEQRARDVLAIVQKLKKHKNIDKTRIGLIGSSQGGWIIPMVASRTKDVTLTVCISGAASSVGVSDFYDNIAEESESIESAIAKLPEFKGEHGFDPLESLKKLTSPGLWIYGGQDKSNPTIEDMRILNEVKDAGNKPFTIHLYPSYTHDLIDTETGSFGIKVIPDLREWVIDKFKV